MISQDQLPEPQLLHQPCHQPQPPPLAQLSVSRPSISLIISSWTSLKLVNVLSKYGSDNNLIWHVICLHNLWYLKRCKFLILALQTLHTLFGVAIGVFHTFGCKAEAASWFVAVFILCLLSHKQGCPAWGWYLLCMRSEWSGCSRCSLMAILGCQCRILWYCWSLWW